MVLVYAGDDEESKPLGFATSTQAEYLRMANEIREDCGDVLLGDVTGPWLRDHGEAQDALR